MLTDHQREQLDGNMILTGAAGTGKTTVARHWILERAAKYPGNVAAIAFTNKAVQRLRSVVGDDSAVYFKTIHSATCGRKVGEDRWVFEHNADNPMPYRAVLVDEASMIPDDLMAVVLQSIANEVLIVGDPNQLQPVRAGDPFGDLCNCAHINRGHLTEIHRNAGAIVVLAAHIRLREPFMLCSYKDIDVDAGNNIGFVSGENATYDGLIDATMTAIEHACSTLSVNPIGDCQVITITNQSRQRLNRALQQRLNSAGRKIDAQISLVWEKQSKDERLPKMINLRIGDPVIARERVECQDTESGKSFDVTKATFGEIVGDDGSNAIIKLDSGRVVTANGPELKGWHLAYAITGHNSQGSEWPVAIVASHHRDHYTKFGHRWAYTAITRGRNLTYIAGDTRSFREIARRESEDRISFIREGIRHRATRKSN